MSPAVSSKQKQQLLILAGLLGAGVLFAIYTLAWKPMRDARASRLAETVQLRGRIDKYRKDLKAEPDVRAEIDRVRGELASIRKTHVPSSVMGSSQILDVQSRLEVMARASGFEIDNVREVARRPIPRRLVVAKETPAAARPAPGAKPPAGKAKGDAVDVLAERPKSKVPEKKVERPAAFVGFVAEVGGLAGYDGVVDFLRRVEDHNPYVCVTSLEIQGRPEDPARHRVLIQMEWPVDAPPPPETKPATAAVAPLPGARP